jgi:ketosteroid isomerase-like protein
MSEENVEILRRANASANAGDWDAVVELYRTDAELRDLQNAPDLPEVLHGHDGLRLLLARWTEPFDDFRGEIEEYLDADPWVICDTRWRGKGKGSDIPVEVHVADAYELKDGQIVRAVFGYADMASATEAIREPS